MTSFLRHRIALGMRHRDGSRLTETEIRSILIQKEKTPFSQAWEEYWKEHEKEFESQLGPRILQMTGFTTPPSERRRIPASRLIYLPGQIVESSGTIEAPDHMRWKFTGVRSFPDGYTMQARSLESIFAAGEILGRLRSPNGQAESYIELLSEDGLFFLRRSSAKPLCNQRPECPARRSAGFRRSAGKALEKAQSYPSCALALHRTPAP